MVDENEEDAEDAVGVLDGVAEAGGDDEDDDDDDVEIAATEGVVDSAATSVAS